MYDEARITQFVRRWEASSAHERRHKDQFFIELCDALGVAHPSPTDKAGDYCFEKEVIIDHEDGRASTQFIDFYKRDCFVIEAKQGSEAEDATLGTARRGTSGWDKAMRGAFGQARKYANYLPEGRPPFLITCDIGNVFEVWTGFSGDYGDYGARRTIELARLAEPDVFDLFVGIFTDPLALDPARHAAKVTREVASRLAELAKDLERSGNDPGLVAQFLMRCIFTMFAEDAGLLPASLLRTAIEERWIPEPRRFQFEVEQLWRAMNEGLPFGYEPKLLRFNGGLFTFQQSLPVSADQLRLMRDAAACDWACVEPTVFGTLLERALDPVERHRLGAHFTPREYIERLVRPAVIEPLRAEWELAQAQARQILDKGEAEPTVADRKEAAEVIKKFHAKLAHTRVLDPACGSGNFLYVCLDLFKQIEAEVVRELADLGETQQSLELQGAMVNPGQFLGVELNPRAREVAELVLWIGYLQWYRRTHGDVQPAEPVLHEYRNIVCRDAVLECADIRPRLGEDGKPLTVWDMRTHKTDPITGRDVPDDVARVPIIDYINARPAEWPEADYVVSNPPFVGNKRMRIDLGDGYTEALREAYPDVAKTADLVMYWWHKAARLCREGRLRRFGFITTNSITQTFDRMVVEEHLRARENPLAVVWAIADHPWVDAGADVRIAMTVGESKDNLTTRPSLGRIAFEEKEQRLDPQARRVEIEYRQVPLIHSDLSGGADVTRAVSLLANRGLSFQGMNLVGKGFRLTREEVRAMGYHPESLPPVIRPYMNAHDLTQTSEDRFVIDFFGLSAEEARDKYPPLYQWLFDRVKREREVNKDPGPKKYWWLFGRSRPDLRQSTRGLLRFIITPETAKHRFFVFAPMSLIPDHKLYAICLDDAYFLGVLSCSTTIRYVLASGGRMGVGNDPIFNNTRCFDPFPFPVATEEQKARIRELGEKLDGLRKRVQGEHPDVTLTGMYNALERLREIERRGGTALSAKERAFHEKALIGILKQLHDELDAAVADAYGWPPGLSDDQVLERLVALNHERAAEEERGVIRWLKPEIQNPTGSAPATQPSLEGLTAGAPDSAGMGIRAWPAKEVDQLRAVRDALASRPGTWSVEEICAVLAGAQRKKVLHHLEALEDLGVLTVYESDTGRRWGLLRK